MLGYNHPQTFGDDQALLDDFLDGNKTITLTGLAAGDYAVYTYAWGPESAAYLTRVRVSGAKKDTLQDAIALVRKSISDFPLQFKNFRE